MINVSIDEILSVFTKVLEALKQLFAWLGILILPEEGEYDYPEGGVDLDDIIAGA